MKIAILTSGILPVPAVQGGAVENLIDFYLAYNDIHNLYDITVYSVWDSKVLHHPATKSKTNHYIYIKTNSFVAKIRKNIHHFLKGDEYYHYSIEYFIEQALKHIKKQSYDTIVIENRPAYTFKVRKAINTKIVYHLHNSKLDSQTLHAKEIYESANLIITVSNYISNCIKTINPNDTKCITVHNGIDLKYFSVHTSTIIDRNKFGFTKEDFIVLFSGRINKEKGILELIEAFSMLKQYPLIKLLIIGSSFYGNTNKDNSFITSLKERAQAIDNKIVFTGFIPYQDIPSYLKIANVAAIPSVWDDPFPTTVLEAQAMGLPIITTRRGGIPEEVTNKNAILLDTDGAFVEKLANSILDLYNNPDKRTSMSKASLERSKMFDKETYAKNFFDALNSIHP
ncbi:MAG: glycosyltransferase family 4 protein [Paludibacteraceae bacterium]|nr:glycosyltransferase family 4 protein [Paludibacteraceae bacterium]